MVLPWRKECCFPSQGLPSVTGRHGEGERRVPGGTTTHRRHRCWPAGPTMGLVLMALFVYLFCAVAIVSPGTAATRLCVV